MKKIREKIMIKKAVCLTLSASMALGLAGCGKADAQQASVITKENEEQVLDSVLNAQVNPSHSSEAGKEETVYVLADANGSVTQVIVSDWLKNGSGSENLMDSSGLTDIQNMKGYESFETDEEGNLIWQANGADIYYSGTTDKEVPVEVKLSYQLDGEEISPQELAGKSGKVTIRMDYENKETRTVTIGGKEQEIKVPFAMISGVVLPQDTFSNIEVTNARLLSEGNNSVVVGVAFPGLRESIDMDSLKNKMEDGEDKEKIEELEIPDYIEITADAENFELGMTMTVAMSDILSDIELTDSFDLSGLNDSMDELKEATDKLKDGTLELKDGSGQLKDGTQELLSGTDELWDGTAELKDGTQELYDKSGILNDGAGQLADGAGQLYDGTGELVDGAGQLYDGAGKLDEGAKQVNDGASALYEGAAALQGGFVGLLTGTHTLKDGGQRLSEGTGNLLSGTQSLNDGAHMVKDGVDQVAAQMEMLKAGIGTPVSSGDGVDPANPATLMQVSYLLNQSLKKASMEGDGLAQESYNGILSSLQQQRAQMQANLDAASGNLVAAQDRASAAQADLAAACQADTMEFEVVTGTHEEESYVDVTVDAPVYTTTRVVAGESEDGEGGGEVIDETTDVETQSVTGTGVVTKEVVESDTISVQSVDADNLQQKAYEYQSAMEDVAAAQGEVSGYAIQIAAIDEQIAAISTNGVDQGALIAKWGPAITYAAILDQKLAELSGTLNSQESMAKMTALVQGAGSLADGTQSALLGAAELNSGVNELKIGLDSLDSGAGELAAGAGSLKEGAATLKGGTSELKSGTSTLKSGAGELKDGASALRDGTATLKDGTTELKSGTEQLVQGVGTLNDGAESLKDGAGALRDGVLTLDEGMGTLDEGALALVDGMFEFDEEGISKLTDLFGDDVEDVIDRLKAVADAGKEYNTFTQLPADVDGSVKFIIKTEGVEKQ